MVYGSREVGLLIPGRDDYMTSSSPALYRGGPGSVWSSLFLIFNLSITPTLNLFLRCSGFFRLIEDGGYLSWSGGSVASWPSVKALRWCGDLSTACSSETSVVSFTPAKISALDDGVVIGWHVRWSRACWRLWMDCGRVVTVATRGFGFGIKAHCVCVFCLSRLWASVL